MTDLNDYLDLLFSEQEKGEIYCPTRTKEGIWIQKWFPVQARDSLITWIQIASTEGDVYISPTLFREQVAKKPFAIGSQVVWMEFDGKAEPDWKLLPTPNLTVQTSFEGHYHFYWRLNQLVPGSAVEEINKRLTYFFEADASGWDITQVLRPPDTINYKCNLPVKIVSGISNNRPTAAGLETVAFDSIPSKIPTSSLVVTSENIPEVTQVLAKASLSAKTVDLIFTSEVSLGQRSSTLTRIAHLLVEEGLSNHGEIVSILHTADERIRKYAERDDRLYRLSQLAEFALRSHGSDQGLQTKSPSEILNFTEEVEFLWQPFIVCGGSALLTGAAGVGKSQLSFFLGFNIACGLQDSAVPRKVLILSLEMSQVGVKYIISQQLKHPPFVERMELIDKNLSFFTAGEVVSLKAIERTIERVQPDLVVVDHLTKIMDGDVSDPQAAKTFTAWDQAIRLKYNTSMLYIHHNRKAGSSNDKANNLADVAGSYLLTAHVDTVLTMWNEDKSVFLKTNKIRHGESVERLPLPKQGLCFGISTASESHTDPGPVESSGNGLSEF